MYSQLGETGVLLNEIPHHWYPQWRTGHACVLTIYHVPILRPSLTQAPCNITWPAEMDGALLNLNTVFCDIPVFPWSLSLYWELSRSSHPSPSPGLITWGSFYRNVEGRNHSGHGGLRHQPFIKGNQCIGGLNGIRQVDPR